MITLRTRVLLGLPAGILAVVLPGAMWNRLPPGGRTLETILLFVLFVTICLGLDRWLSYRSKQGGEAQAESREARRLKRLRIGIPEGLANLEALRQQRNLEQRLKLLNVELQWLDFSSASAALQALNNGDIDLCGGGGTPSVFGQAADLIFMRVARDKYTHAGGEAILVAEDSGIESIHQLRGSRVAVEEGSTAHYVLVRALIDAGLKPDELTIVFLNRNEAESKLRSGNVDAWSVWVPYADSPRRKDYPGRSLASLQTLFGQEPSLKLPTLYYATPELVKACPKILKFILEEINEAGAKLNRDNLSAIERLKDELKINSEWIESLRNLANERSIVPLDSRSLTGLQQQADILRELKLIPKRVNIFDGTYSLMMRQNWTF